MNRRDNELRKYSKARVLGLDNAGVSKVEMRHHGSVTFLAKLAAPTGWNHTWVSFFQVKSAGGEFVVDNIETT